MFVMDFDMPDGGAGALLTRMVPSTRNASRP
jgi:hypothetical protein